MNSLYRKFGMNSINVLQDKFLKKKKKDQEIVIKLYTILWWQGQAVKSGYQEYKLKLT
jgi:hypothetical protein